MLSFAASIGFVSPRAIRLRYKPLSACRAIWLLARIVTLNWEYTSMLSFAASIGFVSPRAIRLRYKPSSALMAMVSPVLIDIDSGTTISGMVFSLCNVVMPPRSGADAEAILETVAGFEDPDERQLDLTRKSCKANLNSRILTSPPKLNARS